MAGDPDHRKLSERPVYPDECDHCPARDVGLFSDITGDERERLLQRLRHARGPAGSLLYRQGDVDHSLYIVRLGLVKLVHQGAEGNERIVRLARPGDVIALEVVLGRPYQHTARTMTAFDACRVPVDLVTHEFHRVSGLEQKLYQQWQASVDAADTFLTDFSTGTARARVARLLLFLLHEAPAPVCPSIHRDEMGSLLGVTTETVSRIMAELKRDGVVDEHGDHCFCKIGALRELAASA